MDVVAMTRSRPRYSGTPTPTTPGSTPRARSIIRAFPAWVSRSGARPGCCSSRPPTSQVRSGTTPLTDPAVRRVPASDQGRQPHTTQWGSPPMRWDLCKRHLPQITTRRPRSAGRTHRRPHHEPAPMRTGFVLVHGAWSWCRVRPLLRLPVVPVDLPGHAGSPAPTTAGRARTRLRAAPRRACG